VEPNVGSAHPVRVVRRAPPPEPSPGQDAPTTLGRLPGSPNLAGTRRAQRTFTVFLSGLIGIFAVFLGLLATAPAPGVRTNVAAYGLFSLAFAGIAIASYVWTIHGAPRSVSVAPDCIVVVERSGTERIFPASASRKVTLVRRYRPDAWGPACDLVQISTPGQWSRSYLVGVDAIPTDSGPAAA
jgi:hypothetical protein